VSADARSRVPTVEWLFLVSVALFISAIAFIVAGARSARPQIPTHADVPPAPPVASVKQIMNAIVLPNANVIYNAVGTIMTGAKVEEIAPKNDKEWAAVGDSAAAIVESGTMLLVGDRLVDKREWLSYTERFIAAGKAALAAANEKKPDGVLAAGGDLNETCDACHEKYQRQ
jgi:hypothetical protein